MRPPPPRDRRLAVREWHRAERHHKQVIALAAVLLVQGVDVSPVLDKDELQEALRLAGALLEDNRKAP